MPDPAHFSRPEAPAVAADAAQASAWGRIDAYFESRLLPCDKTLQACLRDSLAAGMPAIAVSPLQGQWLAQMARLTGARRILEIGTLGGYSTIWLGRALAPGGRLVSLEISPTNAEVARRNIARAGLGDAVEVRVGPALETLPTLEHERFGPCDLVFIDADKQHNPEYFQHAMSLTRPGSVIIVDNVVRAGAVLDAATTDPNTRGVQRLVELVRTEVERGTIKASMLQGVGAKGWDGMLVATRT